MRDDIATGISIRRAQVQQDIDARRRMIGSTVARAYVHRVETDPDFEPELPPSPTFWPRDEPKEPQR